MRIVNVNWNEIQQKHNEGMYFNDISKVFGVSRTAINTAIEKGLFVKIIHKRCWTVDEKKELSEKRRVWLKNNPDKHVWRRHSKFKSVPCERLKQQLKDAGISFVEEFEPVDNRFFSIDISFPDKKLGIDVNGQQHYNSDGTLKEYYQNRHDLIVQQGWELIELHYSVVYVDNIVNDLILKIKQNYGLKNQDYSQYIKIKKEKKKYVCSICGNSMNFKSNGRCRLCYFEARRKIERTVKGERPNREDLEKMVKEMPMTRIGLKYGVSDNAVRKWCKNYGIQLQDRRAHWAKLKVLKI